MNLPLGFEHASTEIEHRGESVQSKLDQLDFSVGDQGYQNSILFSEINVLNTQIYTLEADINAFNSQIYTLEEYIGVLEANIGALEIEIYSPEISTSNVSDSPENQTNVIDIDSTDNLDSEGSGLNYILTGGADQALLTIDFATGELSFITPPDFESPDDADNDNNYQVQITVIDTGGFTDIQDFTITVTDANDAPVITTNSEASFFPSSVELSDLDGSDGFVINGINAYDSAGISVSSAGDVNGDGIDDIIIGAPSADSNGNNGAGVSYVVFGRNGGFGGASLDLSSLDGTNGFALNGINSYDVSGRSVSGAGDVNGDGIDDIIIGAPGADPYGSQAGESYVVFGSDQSFDSSFDLSSLDGSNGFVFKSIASGNLGYSVSDAGDVNGDGIDDVLIGDSDFPAKSYVIFGRSNGFNSTLNEASLAGGNGIVIEGISTGLGVSSSFVSSAGDINGDGIDDLIIGAPGASFSYYDEFGYPSELLEIGVSYVVFGKDTVNGGNFSDNLDLATLDGTNGFAIYGGEVFERSGWSVSGAGDINGDGIDDLIIGARYADPNFYGDPNGKSYVVFGSDSGFAASFELPTLDGTNGFAINGINDGDEAGFSVSGAGDVNGDGIDDVLISGNRVDLEGNYSYNGQTYVVFGSNSGFAASIELSSLDGNNGFAVNGDFASFSGYSVSDAGDVNGDGIDDLIIGAPFAATDAGESAGESYVVFGIPSNSHTVPENQTLAIDVQSIDDNDSEGSGLTYTLTGGDDQALFTIDSGTGTLSFIAAPDFEAPSDTDADNEYQVQVTVTDTGGLSDFQDLTVTVSNVNEAPVITNSAPANPVPENTTTVINIDAIDDSDSEGSGLTYTLTGGDDQALFTIDSATGALNFITAPDFEAPSDADVDNNYQVQITVTDTGGLTDVQDMTISVTDVNNDPIVEEGGSGNDYIQGGPDSDTLNGGAGNDNIQGFAGADVLDGGDGFDLLNYRNSNAGVTVDLSAGTGSGGHAEGDTFSNFELVFGSNFDDSISGGVGNDDIQGFAGADVLDGGDGFDILNYRNSNAGVNIDLLAGTASGGHAEGDTFSNFERVDGSQFDDSISGGAGNDDIQGFAGADVLNGGNGNDNFILFNLTESIFDDFDVITDLEIGTDNINAPTSVTSENVNDFGTIAELTSTALTNALTTLGADNAAYLAFDSRTFFVLNDGTAGFDANFDAVIEITGFTGDLNNLDVI